MKRTIWILLGVACWVLCAVFVDKKIYPSVAIFLTASGWFFLCIFIGGKKGLAVGMFPLLFVGIIYFAWFLCTQSSVGLVKRPFNINDWWVGAKAYLDTLENKPLALVGIYLVVIVAFLIPIVVPLIAVRRAWRSVNVKVEEKPEEKKEEKISSWREFKVKY